MSTLMLILVSGQPVGYPTLEACLEGNGIKADSPDVDSTCVKCKADGKFCMPEGNGPYGCMGYGCPHGTPMPTPALPVQKVEVGPVVDPFSFGAGFSLASGIVVVFGLLAWAKDRRRASTDSTPVEDQEDSLLGEDTVE